jgi:hypothetical protein
MVQLGRATGRLLRVVAGKPHASSDDHDEDAADAPHKSTLTKEEEDALIHADPLSSDDEAPAPAPVSASPAKPSKPLDKSASKKRTRKKSIRVPKKGTFDGGRAGKVQKAGVDEEEKENRASSPPRGSSGKRAADEDEDDAPIWGFGFERPAKRQRIARTSNIHAPASARGYGRRQVEAAALPKPRGAFAVCMLPVFAYPLSRGCCGFFKGETFISIFTYAIFHQEYSFKC